MSDDETIFERLAARPSGKPNTSSAVRQQRSEPHDSLDDFPTPPWAVRALLNYIAGYSSERLGELTAREPCANRGHMLRVMLEYFAQVDAADVHDYGLGLPIRDFLFPGDVPMVDWTVLNAPFRLAEQFITTALDTSRKGVAVIARSAFLEGENRYERLFAKRRPSVVLQFVERVPMLKGRLVRKGEVDPMAAKPGAKAGTATAYSAVIWFADRQSNSTMFDFIPPCRLSLEREGDYPDPVDGLATLSRAPGL